jgi:hypothetical protein
MNTIPSTNSTTFTNLLIANITTITTMRTFPANLATLTHFESTALRMQRTIQIETVFVYTALAAQLPTFATT